MSTGVSHAKLIEDFNFNNISCENGLTQSTISDIYQDDDGYMWIGTHDGLNVYNGYDFKYYRYSNKDKVHSICDNFITNITEDENGYIWVTTINGLSRINTSTGETKN